jgi:hypothetical protein
MNLVRILNGNIFSAASSSEAAGKVENEAGCLQAPIVSRRPACSLAIRSRNARY